MIDEYCSKYIKISEKDFAPTLTEPLSSGKENKRNKYNIAFLENSRNQEEQGQIIHTLGKPPGESATSDEPWKTNGNEPGTKEGKGPSYGNSLKKQRVWHFKEPRGDQYVWKQGGNVHQQVR